MSGLFFLLGCFFWWSESFGGLGSYSLDLVCFTRSLTFCIFLCLVLSCWPGSVLGAWVAHLGILGALLMVCVPPVTLSR
jgi:hypothetical protein